VRANFVQVTNIIPGDLGGKNEQQQQRANVPPIIDYMDLMRSGLYPLIQHTNCYQPTATTRDVGSAPAKTWTWIAADRTIGGHLRWSGQFTLKGIVEPICEGDNLQVEDLVYHIEQVSHSMNVNQNNGSITWETSLVVTNGVPSDGQPVPDQAPELLDAYVTANATLGGDDD
jgi:hypothetical protein